MIVTSGELPSPPDSPHNADLVRPRRGTARMADQMQIRRFCVR